MTTRSDEISRPGRLLRASGVVAAGGVVLIIMAVVLLLLLTPDNRPGDRVKLLGSTWTVTEIDRVAVNGAVTLTFDDGANFGRFHSDCSTLAFEWSTDTDGSAFSIGERSFEETGCSTEAKARDASLRAALAHVDEWRAPVSNRIEFLGERGATVFAAQTPG